MGRQSDVCVLTSGGADSAVLVHLMSRQFQRVHPVYVRTGTTWDDVEQAHLGRFLAALDADSIQTVRVLDMNVGDVYGSHWSVTGEGTPPACTPTEAVYMPGRNLILLAKTAVWCVLNRVPVIAMGALETNTHPDNTPDFWDHLLQAVNLGMRADLVLLRPFDDKTKDQVLQLGRDLPLWLTFSCIRPVGERHCGRCHKCDERASGFRKAGIEDRTDYAEPPVMSH